MKKLTKSPLHYLFCVCLLSFAHTIKAQPLLETGGQKMPDEWIDKAPNQRVVNLTNKAGRGKLSFIFPKQHFNRS